MIEYSISDPIWIKREDWDYKYKERVCLVKGLITDRDDYKDKKGRVYIDASIARLMVKLNDAGCFTEFCCSGLMEDHTRQPYAGYISFLRHRKKTFPYHLPKGLRWDGGCIRSKHGMSEVDLRRAWALLEQSLPM